MRVYGILEFTTLDDEIPGPSIAFSGAFDENCPETDPQFPSWKWTLVVDILLSVELTTL